MSRYLDGVPRLPATLLTQVDSRRRRLTSERQAEVEDELDEHLTWLKWLVRMRRAGYERDHQCEVENDPPSLPLDR